MTIAINRKSQLIINENAVYHNINQERKLLDKDSELFMVVKANAYGHGAVKIAEIAKRAGATGFCVAVLDEAIELRKAGFIEPILVLGLTDVNLINLIQKYDISVTVSSIDWIKEANQLIKENNFKNKIKIHLALDTGMGRIGLQSAEEVKKFIGQFEKMNKLIDLEGVFTHFSTADSDDSSYFEYQRDHFFEMMNEIPNRPKYVHVANSATSLWHDLTGSNMIRFGIAGYGYNPSGNLIEPPFELKPAMSLISELVYVKKVPEGKSIGYGATYTTKNEEWIGTVPIGYADGIRRELKGFNVLVDGHYCEIVGRICMDQLMIRLPYDIIKGTTVTFIGENQGKSILMQDVADYCQTITHAIVCGFSERLPRIYQSN
ncbi:alanine racemase [Lactobacillus sp. S2-2]|uniref:alanine racemase n=1 Tax=Lactobacillus sp. S2-2 TaxID=2692917 RepID=UPI001F02F42C|nr:alanine racemase [Lactobacillus sp. S2-2]MCF6515869.1 alanine racemase [Lactobacillus sp. S2-2]